MLTQVIQALRLLGFGLLFLIGFFILTAPNGKETDEGFQRTEK